jgi:signal transduction histidine kinase
MPSSIAGIATYRGRISLRLQLMLWIMIVFTAIQWTVTATFWIYQRSELQRTFMERFLSQAQIVRSDLTSSIPVVSRDSLDERQSQQLMQTQFSDYSIDVLDQHGNLLVEQGPIAVDTRKLPIEEAMSSAAPIVVEDPVWSSLPGNLDPDQMLLVLTRTVGVDDQPYLLIQTTSDRFAENQANLISKLLLIFSLMTPFLGLFGGWFISGIAITPLLRLQKALMSLNPESLDDAIEVTEESPEIAELIEQLDESRERIREAFAAQERFISNVSHEIKTPIAVMQIEAETLDTSGSSEEVREFVDSVHTEMSRLGKLVESFLTLTRIEDGEGKTHATRYGANDLVMDSVDHCYPMAEQHEVQIDPVLLDSDETLDTFVLGNPDLLMTMLDNLIRNAIRYSPVQGVVRCSLEVMDGSVHIHVSDEGPGIPPEKIDHVFDRFSQVQGKERQGRGHGLGLAIAKGIAELHSGSISVENNADRGCTFTIHLPLPS